MGRTDLELCAALKTECSLAGHGALGVPGRTVSEVRVRETDYRWMYREKRGSNRYTDEVL